MMEEAQLFDIMRQGLWVSVVMSTPILATALVVGLVIGLFQALTSIQEMTLTFVPKLAAIVVVFWASMGFMTISLTDFFKAEVLTAVEGS